MTQEHFLSIVKWVDPNGNKIVSSFFSNGRDKEEAQSRAHKMYVNHMRSLYGGMVSFSTDEFGGDIDITSFVTDIIGNGHVFDMPGK